MRVRFDAAREDVLAARVDDAICSYVQGFADQGDPLAFDIDVADVVVRRGDDAAAFDQNRHRGSPPFGRCLVRYLPPSVRWMFSLCHLRPYTSTPAVLRLFSAAASMSVR